MAENTHVTGEYVTYRTNGICVISGICERDYGGGKKEYYELRSVYDDNTRFYVPTSSDKLDSLLHNVLSVDEIDSIIDAAENMQPAWINDSRERSEKYGEMLRSDNLSEVLWLVKVLSLNKNRIEAEKRKFYVCDEKLLAAAERIITEEFAFVLGIEKKDVIPYILKRVSDKEVSE